MTVNPQKSRSNRLALGTAIAAALLSGYGSRQAFAGSCPGAAGTYTCSGAANVGTDSTQFLNPAGNPLTVTTTAGFGLNVSGAYGFRMFSSGTELSFVDNNASSITADLQAIRASNSGTGALTITTTGTVTSITSRGIEANNSFGNGTDLNITTVDVLGGYHGIQADNQGSGALTIISSGTVTGTSNLGIRAFNSGTNLNITAVDVLGGYRGIEANNSGSGATNISTSGTVTGTNNDGINATNNAGTTNLNITAVDVSGKRIGIFANNAGTGEINITSTGTVTGTISAGIDARNNNVLTTDLTITTAAVSGGGPGIYAKNSGTGVLTISSSGTVTGINSDGIYAKGYGTDLGINAADTTGRLAGIRARNIGSGAVSVSITSTGTVTGTLGDGIHAQGFGTDLSINAADTSGGQRGIFAYNNGSGATTITSTGTTTGTANSGIFAYNTAAASNLTVTAADTTGGQQGIYARNYGTGTTSITVSGAVTGGTGAGIDNNSSNATTITLNTGASVSAASGNAIIVGSGNATVTLNTGSSVTGNIALGGGSDTIVLAGGNFSNITSFDGGAGTNDSLVFSGSTGVFNPAIMNNIESVTIDSGSTMGLTFTGNAFNASALTGSKLTVQNGGILNATNGFALTGNLVSSTGVVSMQNGAIDAAATISGDFTGGGQLLIDADFATDTADTLTITGNVLAGGTQVSVNDISSGPATGADITLVSVGGTTAAGDFALASNVVNGAYDYNTLSLVGNDWVLQSVGGITPSVPVFTPFASTFEALSQSLLTLENLPSYSDRIRHRMTGASAGDDTGIDAPVWMRISGGKRKIDSRRSTTGTDFDTNQWQAQIGVDFTLTDTASHQFVLGVNAGYGQANTDVNATTGKGDIDTDSYSIGLSGTWQLANSSYIDLQAQKSWYETDLSANGTGAGSVNGIDGDGYSASIEAGRSYAFSDTLTVTPQAQLVYAKVDTDNFTGANGEIVRLTDSKSLKARMGAELNKQFTEGGATQGFILANVIHEFKDKTQVNVSGAQLANSVDGWSGELGAGITHAWDTGTTHCELFAAVTAGTSLNHVGNSNSVQGEAGFKMNF